MRELALAGDPEAMRETARTLVAQADAVRLVPEGPGARLEALVLEGPAAERLWAAADEVRRQARQAAAELEAIAAALQADAGRVEQMNDTLRAEAERRAAQEAAHARAGAAGEPKAPPAAAPATDAPAGTAPAGTAPATATPAAGSPAPAPTDPTPPA